ncbi:MAG: transcriptional regulator NrdR [Candidatus Micrarchaeia archaeon]
MKCPYCGHPHTKVINSRESNDGLSIRRRRVCLSCGERFTTYENIRTGMITIIKKDGRREIFDRNKILEGLMKACEKRSISRADIEAITDRVEQKLKKLGKNEIPSKQVGDFVMDELLKLDAVAYVRFASVYLSIDRPEEFIKIVKEIKKNRNNA